MLKKYSTLLIFLSLITVFQACTTSTNNRASEIYARNILVLPTQVGHAELNSFQSRASRLFEKELRGEGFNTIKLSSAMYRQANAIALEKTGSVYDPKLGVFSPMNKPAYAKEMMYLLLSKKNFDLLVFPSIVLREADVDKETGTAEFDGVVKKLTFDKNIDQKTYPEIARGLSFKVVAITREKVGPRAAVAGISLPFNVSEGLGGMTLTLKTELISDKELNDAVERVTEPFMQQVRLP